MLILTIAATIAIFCCTTFDSTMSLIEEQSVHIQGHVVCAIQFGHLNESKFQLFPAPFANVTLMEADMLHTDLLAPMVVADIDGNFDVKFVGLELNYSRSPFLRIEHPCSHNSLRPRARQRRALAKGERRTIAHSIIDNLRGVWRDPPPSLAPPDPVPTISGTVRASDPPPPLEEVREEEEAKEDPLSKRCRYVKEIPIKHSKLVNPSKGQSQYTDEYVIFTHKEHIQCH